VRSLAVVTFAPRIETRRGDFPSRRGYPRPVFARLSVLLCVLLPAGCGDGRSDPPAATPLAALVSADDARAVRQVGFVDHQGKVAAHTGESCIEAAGHHVGDGYTVQANMMTSDAIVPAMAKAYEAAGGPLPERLVAALQAAERAGGDLRGKQSAAILVVKGESSGQPWADRVVELRIEDHPDPVAELARLLVLHRAYEHMNAGDAALEDKDTEAALAHYRAANELAPDNVEMAYWHGITLATLGKIDEALPLLRTAFAADPGWAELTRRLVKPGIIPDTPAGRALVERLLRDAR
jgi:uncharacterized Ntn-hydrolase superfamily protein